MTTINFTAFMRTEEKSISDAILRAQRRGWTLNTYADPVTDGRENCGAAWAERIAEEDPSLVYLTR